MPGNYSLVKTVITGETILAADRNAEHSNHITNHTPSGVDDYSVNTTQMQSATDPYPASVESLATTLAGEIERVRYLVKQISGKAQWYIDPSYTLDQLLPLAGGTMTGVLNTAHGSDIASAGTINLTTATGNLIDVTGTTTITAVTLADGATRIVRFTGALTLTNGASLVLPTGANLTTAAGDYAIFAGYAAGVVRCVAYSKVDGTITGEVGVTQISTSIAGSGLSGGGGSALAVNVDASTIEINSDTLRLKDGGTTEAKLATAVQNKLGQNIGMVAIASRSTTGDVVNYSGQGRLRGVCVVGGTSATFTITIDGVLVLSSGVTLPGLGAIWNDQGLTTDAAATLNSLDIFFRTSLVVNISADIGSSTVNAAYERAA